MQTSYNRKISVVNYHSLDNGHIIQYNIMGILIRNIYYTLPIVEIQYEDEHDPLQSVVVIIIIYYILYFRRFRPMQ